MRSWSGPPSSPSLLALFGAFSHEVAGLKVGGTRACHITVCALLCATLCIFHYWFYMTFTASRPFVCLFVRVLATCTANDATDQRPATPIHSFNARMCPRFVAKKLLLTTARGPGSRTQKTIIFSSTTMAPIDTKLNPPRKPIVLCLAPTFG